jgi:hypothetical protein
MQQIYQNSVFLFLYQSFKTIWGFFTGTTELYRICDALISIHRNEAIEIPSDVDIKLFAHKHCRKISLDAESLFRIEQCILHSQKLDSFRRPFESWFTQFEQDPNDYVEPGTGQKFEKLYQLLLELKKFPVTRGKISPQAMILRSGLIDIYTTFQLLHELNARAATRYDCTVTANEKKLKELWELLMPGKELKGRYTLQWQQIGFQGKDPATDFRAMGLLALDNLHYFAEKYKTEAHRILKASHHPISWFSFGTFFV